jgi:hypothetical protein
MEQAAVAVQDILEIMEVNLDQELHVVDKVVMVLYQQLLELLSLVAEEVRHMLLAVLQEQEVQEAEELELREDQELMEEMELRTPVVAVVDTEKQVEDLYVEVMAVQV